MHSQPIKTSAPTGEEFRGAESPVDDVDPMPVLPLLSVDPVEATLSEPREALGRGGVALANVRLPFGVIGNKSCGSSLLNMASSSKMDDVGEDVGVGGDFARRDNARLTPRTSPLFSARARRSTRPSDFTTAQSLHR